MSNVIQFPKLTKAVTVLPTSLESANPYDAVWRSPKALVCVVIRVLWIVAVLLWPLLRWAGSLEVLYQFARTVYYWDAPTMHAGWTLLLHFSALTGATYFVSVYKPKGM